MRWSIDGDDYDWNAELYTTSYYDDQPVKHVPPTKRQVYEQQLRGYQSSLALLIDDLVSFNKYTADAAKELAKWQGHVSRKESEIVEMNTWIDEFRVKYGYD